MRITIKAASLSITRLKEKNSVEKVLYLNSVRKNPSLALDKKYQTTFNDYYKVRQKSSEFYKFFYALLNETAKKPKDVTIENLLNKLFINTDERHLSFCSKILATVRNDAVIFDKNVASQLNIPSKSLPKKDWEFVAKKRYSLIKRGLEKIFKQSNWVSIELMFDQSFPEGANLTRFRKVDLILWRLI